MKTNTLIGVLMSLLISISSCHHSEDDEFTLPIPKIKTITHFTGSQSTSENYEYDGMGRILKISYGEGNYTGYMYREKFIIKTNIFENDNLFPIDTLYLNKEGLVVAELYGTATHEYSSQGYRSRSTYYNSNGEIGLKFDFKNRDENTSSCDGWENVGGVLKLTMTYDYQYLTNQINTIGNENMGIAFYGKQDKYLRSASELTLHFIDEHDQVDYLYELDSQNRVVKKWTQGSPATVYDTYTYYN